METQTHKIGEHTYEIRQLGAKEGFRMLAKLTKLAGPAMAQAAVEPAAAIRELAFGLDPDELLAVAETFAKSAKVRVVVRASNGTENEMPLDLAGAFDRHFVGRYDELVGFVVMSALVNFGVSLTRGKALSDQVLEAASRLRSPSTSTGGSGAS